MAGMPDIWLATCADLPDGGTDGPHLDAAFTALGVDARWAVWDDPAVDWAAAPLVAVRSTWDYHLRYDEFLAWAARVDGLTRLVNPLPVLRWNTRKDYLIELGALGVPVVPTDLVPAGEPFTALVDQVVKPVVGASGGGVTVVRRDEVLPPAAEDRIAQPLVESIRTDGEYSVFVLGGTAVAAAVKRPAGDEVRVHERYGGSTKPTELTDELRAASLTAVRAAEDRFGVSLPYARADLMRLAGGTLAVNELELAEPGLYATVLPEVPPAYAEALSGR
jgi:hypothetical protein